MYKAVIVVCVAALVLGTLLRGLRSFRRWRALRTVDREQIERISKGVSIRALVTGPHALPGLDARHTNRTVGDLVLAPDRFLLTSGRGVLADLGPGRGRLFTSVRCTGPGRLVIEGDVANPDRAPGLYRFEIAVPDAAAWAEDLARYVREGEDATRFARPPWAT